METKNKNYEKEEKILLDKLEYALNDIKKLKNSLDEKDKKIKTLNDELKSTQSENAKNNNL